MDVYWITVDKLVQMTNVLVHSHHLFCDKITASLVALRLSMIPSVALVLIFPSGQQVGGTVT